MSTAVQLGLFCWLCGATSDCRPCCWCGAPACALHLASDCGLMGCSRCTAPAPPPKRTPASPGPGGWTDWDREQAECARINALLPPACLYRAEIEPLSRGREGKRDCWYGLRLVLHDRGEPVRTLADPWPHHAMHAVIDLLKTHGMRLQACGGPDPFSTIDRPSFQRR